jgi:hypothetical protein
MSIAVNVNLLAIKYREMKHVSKGGKVLSLSLLSILLTGDRVFRSPRSNNTRSSGNTQTSRTIFLVIRMDCEAL